MKQYLDNVEEIIDKEIQAYNLLEKYILEKTNILTQNKVAFLENLDVEIIQQTTKVANLAKARQQQCVYIERIDLTLSELIKKAFAFDETQAGRLIEKKDKLDLIIDNIQRQNTLLIMNKTIEFILKIIAPELDSYNQMGQIKKPNDNYKISSIEQEV